MKTVSIHVDAIWSPKREGDPILADKVAAIAEGFKACGHRIPISVRRNYDPKDECEFEIVAGRHRYAAAKRLGWKEIECVIEKGTETEAELWQVSENLHRTNMNARATALAITRFRALLKKRAKEEKEFSRQNAAKTKKESKRGRIGEGRPTGTTSGSLRETAKALGIDEKEVRRSEQIAKMNPDAAAVLDAMPDAIKATQADYLTVAAHPNADQVTAAKQLAKRKQHSHDNPTAPKAKPNAIKKAWDKASDAHRVQFVKHLIETHPDMLNEMLADGADETKGGNVIPLHALR